MVTSKKRIFFVLIVLIAAGSLYFLNSKKNLLEKNKLTEDPNAKYVKFEMEVYDKISTVYWNKTTEADLVNLFKLSVEKALASSTGITPKTKADTEKMFSTAFSFASTTDAKKQLAINTVIVALYNLPPAGRNQIFSQKQETAFRQTVANVNPNNDLYSNLGAKIGASIEEVQKAYETKKAELKNATSSEAKAELAQVEHAKEVLTNQDNKTLYDQAKIEPTLKYKKIGTTFYADLSQISPSSLYELVRAIDNASTTKMDSLIVDFRGNIGGALDFLPAFFGLFVGKDQFVFDLFHQGERNPQRTTQPKYPEFDKFKEIAILTDNMSQSTAELTAATFKKFHMAKVIGKTTRGWGTVENTYPIETEIDSTEKYVLLLVNSITLRDDGEPIEGRGVDPDIDITKTGWQNKLSQNFKSQSLIDAIKTVVK